MGRDENTPTVLVVCTANICRSPMAEALLADRFRAARAAVTVHSAGLHAVGGPADEKACRVMATRGLDVTAHASRSVTAGDIGDAALVLAMERAHVAEIATIVTGTFAKTFGLTEIVALGEQTGPRRGGETLEAWLARLHRGRRPADVLQASAAFDVADPHGGSLAEYERCADQLARLVDSLVALLEGPDIFP